MKGTQELTKQKFVHEEITVWEKWRKGKKERNEEKMNDEVEKNN